MSTTNLENFMKSTEGDGARVSLDDKWLYWDGDAWKWVVLQRPYAAKRNRTLYEGDDIAAALRVLAGEEQ